MLIWALVFFLASAASAFAQNYLPLADIPTAQARSVSQCAALQCDGVATKYWWPVQPLTDSTASLVIQPSGSFGQSFTNAKGTGTLTAGEIAALKTSGALLTKLPFILSTPNFKARFTSPQQTAIAADATAAVEWTAINGAATVNLQNPVIVDWVNNTLVTRGLIPVSQTLTVLAPVAVAVVPP